MRKFSTIATIIHAAIAGYEVNAMLHSVSTGDLIHLLQSAASLLCVALPLWHTLNE